MSDHDYFMRLALEEAEKGRLTASPNPHVGCVIVKNNQVVAKAHHEYCGSHHAEINALNKAGAAAKESDVYITLEPCAHYGKTPPCVDALIEARIKRVIIPFTDPNPLVQGQSIQKLKDHGIEVITGILSAACYESNRIFLHRMKTGQPYVIAKWAMTKEGLLTKPESPWITHAASREHAHALRQISDAILVGAHTIRKDNPALTTRHVDLKEHLIRHPRRIILSTKGELPFSSTVLTAGTVIVTSMMPDKENLQFFEKNQIEHWHLPNEYHQIHLPSLLLELKKINVYSLMIEGGRYTLDQFFKHNVVNEFQCYIADEIFNKELLDNFLGNQHYKIIEQYPIEVDNFVCGLMKEAHHV